MSTAASYGKGIRNINFISTTYFGTSTTLKMMLQKIKEYPSNIDKHCKILLCDKKRIFNIIHNNQKGFPKKNQRFGNSNDFALVCGRTFCEYVSLFQTKMKSSTNVTFSDQDIPSVLKQRHYETFYCEKDCISTANYYSTICHAINIIQDKVSVDFTGKCVRAYLEMCKLCDIL